ncbi:MAG: hypothetical protein LBV80_11255 [Deltaproteobacteria bacterium]|jgi:hypothetical protein|nr:hypothetical protein [Deltaproteobacteria bacterium]
MIAELMNNVMHSTPQGFLGVGLILFYFVLIVSAAAMRIARADHMNH